MCAKRLKTFNKSVRNGRKRQSSLLTVSPTGGEVRSESSEQIAFMDRVRWMLPSIEPFVAAVANGGMRDIRTAVRLRAEGVRPGYPDIAVMLARRGYHGLLIEMKRADGGVVADQQAWLHSLYRAEGYRVDICAGAERAWSLLLWYVGLTEVES